MATDQPLVVIGLDGATWRLLDKWIEAGALPNLGKIKSEGSCAPLESCLPPVTSPSWKCYSTGKNPGKLGVYWWEIVDVDNRKISIPDSRSFHSPELWDYLGDAGYNWATINMPTTFPPHGADNGGIMVAGPNTNPEKAYTSPPELKQTLEDQFDYKPIPDRSINQRGALKEIYHLIDTRFEVGKWLLETEDLDFLHLTTFLTNKLHHYFWDGPETKEGWKRVDQHLEWFIDREYNLLFLSDHGSNEIKTQFQINAWLESEGYLQQSTEESLATQQGMKYGFTQEDLSRLAARLNLRETARSIVPDRLIDFLPKKSHKKGNKIDAIKWEATQALASGQGLVYLTNPDATEANAIREKIKSGLEELTDPRGHSVAKEVFTVEEVYTGDHLDLAPDIIFDQAEGIHTEDHIGHHDVFEEPTGWRGENDRHGIFLAHGPSFSSKGKLPNPKITDVASTILHYMDVPVPADVDGSPIDVFTPGSRAAERELTYQDPRPTPSQLDQNLQSTEERLRELGYLN